jgi:GT2 family glycosyltransferase
MRTLPATVIVPTIGRPAMLALLLDSLAAGDALPDEVIVIDQSGDDHAHLTLDRPFTVRVLHTTPPNIARAMNAGLRAARNDRCLITNDDITVATSWVRLCCALQDAPGVIATGRVLAGGSDSRRVPSVMLNEFACDYRSPQPWGIFPGNCAVDRVAVLALGGFDERDGFRIAAEDNDLAWRWLAAGNVVRYRPELVVWHHDWRSADEIARRFREYGAGQGALYGKHLARGDLAILPFAVRDVARGLRGQVARILKRRAPHTDWRQGLFPGVVVGIVRGAYAELSARRSR